MDEQLTTGEVIRGTLAEIGENARAVILFVLVLSVVSVGFEFGLNAYSGTMPLGLEIPQIVQSWLGIGAGLGGLAVIVITVIGNYLLWEALLRNAGYLQAGEGKRIFAFIGQAILVALCTSFGFLLLIIPGLIFGARWAATPAFLIAEREGVIDAMGKSWDMVRGNTTPVVFAYLLGIVAMMMVGGMIGFSATSTVAIGLGSTIQSLLAQIVSSFGTALQVALGVFVFRRLYGPSQEVVNVFA